jgi:hypothetical protein
MKHVGVREFRDHATRYLSGDEILAVERHGQPLGFYIPAGASRYENFEEALTRLERTVRRVLTDTGISEEELVHLLSPNESVPEGAPAGSYAPRH